MQAEEAAFLRLRSRGRTLRFYEAGKPVIPDDDRVPQTSFESKDARYIWWELELKYPATQTRIDFRLHAIYINGDDQVIFEDDFDTAAQAGWDHSHHTKGYGWEEPGHWPKGNYRVEIYAGRRMIASNGFSVR